MAFKSFALVVLVFAASWFAKVLYAEGQGGGVIFEYSGKKYSAQDLTQPTQQRLFEIEMNRSKSITAVIDSVILDFYFDEQAKKKNLSVEAVKEAELNAKEPTESEIKKFYEENKARIPSMYKYEQIKDELKKTLMEQTKFEKREKLLATIKKSANFKLLVYQPNEPVVGLNVGEFPSKGKKGAKVKMVEFADFSCGHCGAASGDLKKLVDKYSNKMEFVFVHFLVHPGSASEDIAQGAYCAMEQGKFWEYHDMAFQRQQNLTNKSPFEFAKELKLDEAKFKQCQDSARSRALVDKGRAEGERVGVSATPTIFINGKKYYGGHTFSEFEDAVKKELK